jgi:hypothetical protein
LISGLRFFAIADNAAIAIARSFGTDRGHFAGKRQAFLAKTIPYVTISAVMPGESLRTISALDVAFSQ